MRAFSALTSFIVFFRFFRIFCAFPQVSLFSKLFQYYFTRTIQVLFFSTHFPNIFDFSFSLLKTFLSNWEINKKVLQSLLILIKSLINMIELIWKAVFESKNRFLFEKTKKIMIKILSSFPHCGAAESGKSHFAHFAQPYFICYKSDVYGMFVYSYTCLNGKLSIYFLKI